MEGSSILSVPWYYRIEVKKGVFTDGLERPNLALTRKLLRNINIQNRNCIDVGTQEAIIPILLKKAGANKVVGFDRLDLSQKINYLSQVYQVHFDYMGGTQLQELPGKLMGNDGERFFDLVVFSGVLYHMINPFGSLALVRGLCKSGGFLLIETAAIQDPKEMLVFNARGELYGQGSNYFVPTTAWLEYALRMLGLMPLAAVYLGKAKNGGCIRLAILCHSQIAPCPSIKDDAWVSQKFHAYAFNSEARFDWKKIEDNQTQMDYAPYDPSVLNLNHKSLYDELRKHPEYVFSSDETMLTLESRI